MRWLLALFMIGGCLAAETVQIGSGTLVNQSLPIEPARAYSYSQQVYLASAAVSFFPATTSGGFGSATRSAASLATGCPWTA